MREETLKSRSVCGSILPQRIRLVWSCCSSNRKNPLLLFAKNIELARAVTIAGGRYSCWRERRHGGVCPNVTPAKPLRCVHVNKKRLRWKGLNRTYCNALELRELKVSTTEQKITKIARQTIFKLIDDAAIPKTLAVAVAGVARSTYYRWRQIARSTNPSQEQQPKPKYIKLTDRDWVKEALFKTLHSPPSDHGFNRTTWTIDDLQEALRKTDFKLGKHAIRTIIRDAGYRWLKARKVLTSRDPEYRAKLDNIQRILSGLGHNEGFFSIDEYGPFAVKHRGGRLLVAPGEIATVAQWQRSKGFLIITAALELSTNQVTHFYSEKKNTDEMIKLLEVLLKQNRHLSRVYLSWDAASWHISKRLSERIEANNVMAHVTGSTHVELAPLPAGAQFLNVIKSVFSGMARASFTIVTTSPKMPQRM